MTLEQEVELSREVVVGLLRPYVEAREQAKTYEETRSRFAQLIRHYIETHSGEQIWDGEGHFEAYLQENKGAEQFDIQRAPEELVLLLWRLNLLEVNARGVAAQPAGSEARERLRPYAVPGKGSTSLQVKEKKA